MWFFHIFRLPEMTKPTGLSKLSDAVGITLIILINGIVLVKPVIAFHFSVKWATISFYESIKI